jgi:hypothetical protein
MVADARTNNDRVGFAHGEESMARTISLAIAVALFALWAPRSVQATTLSAPFLTVGVGDTFTVEISVIDAADLAFFQFDLAFAPSIVRADTAGATAGADLPADWFFTSPGAVDNLNGDVLGVSASSGFLTFNGTGIIADFEFTALSPGVSPLDFSSVFLNLLDTGFQISNGQITVTGPAQAPEPTTLALLAGGLGLLGARRLLSRQDKR